MEALSEMRETMRREDSESEHREPDIEMEKVVTGLVIDYVAHRARVNDFHSRSTSGGSGVGRNAQPSGATPLTSP